MITIKDVAKEASVSISTVSHVVNGTKNVSPETEKRVRKAIAKLNYRTNVFAKNLKSQKTKRIGLVVIDMCGLFFPYLIKEIYRVALENGYDITLYNSNGSYEQERSAIQDLIDNYVDGIILSSIVPHEKKEAYANELIMKLKHSSKEIPLIMLERDFSCYGLDSICTNTYIGAINAMQHLIDIGCKNIAHIRLPRNAEGRFRGYCDILESNHIPYDERYLEIGDLTHVGGYNCMKKILNKNLIIDAVFIANDQMAVGAIRAINEAGLRIPEDIKVIGFDDVFICCNLAPPLTSVYLNKEKLARDAMKALLMRIDNKGSEFPIKESVDSELVIRSSTDKDAVIRNSW